MLENAREKFRHATVSSHKRQFTLKRLMLQSLDSPLSLHRHSSNTRKDLIQSDFIRKAVQVKNRIRLIIARDIPTFVGRLDPGRTPLAQSSTYYDLASFVTANTF